VDTVLIKEIKRVARADDGSLLLRCVTMTGEEIEVEFSPEAADALRIGIEKLKRPWIRMAESIVKLLRDSLKELFQKKGIEFKEDVELYGVRVDIYKVKGSFLGPPEAYVFVPDIIDEDFLMPYDAVFNDDSRNGRGVVCIIVAAAATNSAIKRARKRVQVYDVYDVRKGDGYDSPILEVLAESAFHLRFKRE